MSITDPSVLPVAQSMLACLTDALADVANPPAYTSLRTGLQVELLLSTSRDECCEGVAWVRVANIYPSANFPDPDVAWDRCSPVQWAAVLELGVARCAPTPDASSIPSSDQWNAVSEAVLDDAAAMRRALCCFAELEADRMWLAGVWTPLPIEGGCLGGTQLVTVAIGACDCDEAEE
jgi:hypothetical protein